MTKPFRYRGQWRDKASIKNLDTEFSRAIAPDLSHIPCGCDPEVAKTMASAKPCRCGSVRLRPVADLGEPPIFAIACDDCGEIEGDAPTLKEAVENWNHQVADPRGISRASSQAS